MAYIIKVQYEDSQELVPIWSSALAEETVILFRDNPTIQFYEIVSDNPTRDECKYIYSQMKRTKYRLPLDFRVNRKRRNNG